MKEHQQTWRELLGKITDDPKEKNRLAAELGVNPLTLSRWVVGESTPRQIHLRRLLDILPEQREQLRVLLSQEFAGTLADELSELPQTLPTEFYAQVLTSLAMIPRILRFSALTELILTQMIQQLDPHRQGIIAIVAQCVPPDGNSREVRSLRERVGRGTPPWSDNLKDNLFLGIESLAGYVVTSACAMIVQDRTENRSLLHATQSEVEMSAAAYPILQSGDVAGCLSVSSTQRHYFTPSRVTLIEAYVHLLSLAFECSDFYSTSAIQLSVMPPHKIQRPYMTEFRHRVLELMLRAESEQQSMGFTQAEARVLKQIERELLAVSAQAGNLEGSNGSF